MAEHQNKKNDWVLPSAPEPVKNIVLVGRTGNGKSATGNTLTRKKVFPSEYSAGSVTTTCKEYRAVTSGPIINVIDTPGLFDTAQSMEFISKEILLCFVLAEQGLHAVVLVLSTATRMSEEEEKGLRTLQILFGSKIVDYLVVVFTGGDGLEKRQTTLDTYLSKGCPEFLKGILRLCGGRKVLFDNETTDKNKQDNQIQELLDHVADIERRNGGIPFTSQMHRETREEAERVRYEKEKIEAKNIATAEKEKLTKELEASHNIQMAMMKEMMTKLLKESTEANERLMGELVKANNSKAEALKKKGGCNIL